MTILYPVHVITVFNDIQVIIHFKYYILMVLIWHGYCALSAPHIHGKAGMQGDSWGPGQHTGPLNEKNDQLSPALLKTHLHPVRFHYSQGPALELQDRTKPQCTDRASQAPISLTCITGPVDSWFSCVKVFWLLSLFCSPSLFSTLPLLYSWQRVDDYQSAWNPISLF